MKAAAKPLSRKWWILGLGVPPLVWADLYTKVLVVRQMHPFQRIPLVEGWFDLYHTRNTGAAFSLFRNLDPAWSLPFFTLVALVAFGVLAYLFFSIRSYETYLALTVTFILSGAVGNFTDRVRFGYVVDFLHFYWKDFYWPTFNVADICISAGAAMLIYYSIFLEPKERRAQMKNETPPGPETTEADAAHAS